VSVDFFIDIKSFQSHYGLGVDSASNRNEYQEYFLGVKSGRCVRLTTLPPSYDVVTKSGSLKFLEPPGSVQACNGTALPFIYRSFQLRRLGSFDIRSACKEEIENAEGRDNGVRELRKTVARILL